MTGCFII